MEQIAGNVLIMVVYMSILTVGVLVANATVILTLLLRRKMISISTQYFLYVINLAVCDLIVGVFLIPVYIAILLGKRMFHMIELMKIVAAKNYFLLLSSYSAGLFD